VCRLATRHKIAPVEGEVVGLIPEQACERESEWMRQLIEFDDQTKILERRLAVPLSWPGEGNSTIHNPVNV
jgi:glutamate formiminotransferase / 5-formyltetrahydrofolate cyclo-ligase